MNSLVYIGVPTTSWGKGQGGNVGASWTLLPSLPSSCSHHSPHSDLAGLCSQCPMNSLICIGVPTTSGGKGLGSKVGGSWTLFPSLPSLPPCWTLLQMSNEQLSMYWGPHHLWGQGARGQCGSKLNLTPITLLTPTLLDLTPNVQWTA